MTPGSTAPWALIAGCCCLIAVTVFAYTEPKWLRGDSVTHVSSANTVPAITVPKTTPEIQSTRVATGTVWFVGDVMLSRQVGSDSRRYGAGYPWQGMADTFGQGNNVLVLNFEGCVAPPLRYEARAPLSFPVATSMLSGIPEFPQRIASLANNHALDCGVGSIQATQENLMASSITAVGHPSEVASSSLALVTVGEVSVAVIALHTLYSTPSSTAVAALLSAASAVSDVQVVYVHWGDEYVLTANASQRALAASWVALGADMVIGHHPHVVQDIEYIDGVPVVYSLGNFIFDQYFSDEVQVGLMLSVRFVPSPVIELVPVTSMGSPGQPRIMKEKEKAAFLLALANRSTEDVRGAIGRGLLPLPALQLATSPQ